MRSCKSMRLEGVIANLVSEIDRRVAVKQELNTAKMTSDTGVMQTRPAFMIHPRHVCLRLHVHVLDTRVIITETTLVLFVKFYTRADT